MIFWHFERLNENLRMSPQPIHFWRHSVAMSSELMLERKNSYDRSGGCWLLVVGWWLLVGAWCLVPGAWMREKVVNIASDARKSRKNGLLHLPKLDFPRFSLIFIEVLKIAENLEKLNFTFFAFYPLISAFQALSCLACSRS